VREGKKVGIFCMGGHGRTGYFGSLVLGMLGVEDPIQLLRDEYCKKVVESKEKINQIAAILGKPALKQHKPSKGGYTNGCGFGATQLSMSSPEPSIHRCYECRTFNPQTDFCRHETRKCRVDQDDTCEHYLYWQSAKAKKLDDEETAQALGIDASLLGGTQ
jgi:hypothetical protein